jgi:hypothetical protein
MEADKFWPAEHSSLVLDGVLAGDAFDDEPTAGDLRGVSLRRHRAISEGKCSRHASRSGVSDLITSWYGVTH